MLKESVEFSPSFDGIVQTLHDVVDVMVTSVSKLPRVESLLFHPVESLPLQRPLDSVLLHEEVISNAKSRIHTVVHANSHGPKK